ncbi:MAG: Hpt domain-containing protein [Bacteroidales bacterium]|nr:Hpt domain-containing protein [Bacteroidales bacterium]
MIDLTYLNDITDGDIATKKQLIQLFFTQAAEIKQRFILAQLSDNIEELGRTAHIAKSTTRVMGIQNVASKMEELQRLTEKKESPEKYPELVNFYLNEIPKAEEELRAELAKL